MAFERYDKKTTRRIYSLYSKVLDNNAKEGITEPSKIADSFIKEIKTKKVATWQSLISLADTKYFYDECIEYAKEKANEYKERYKEYEKNKISDGQLTYLSDMIEQGIRHHEYQTRKETKEELKKILNHLSKAGAGTYIDNMKEIIKKSKKQEQSTHLEEV